MCTSCLCVCVLSQAGHTQSDVKHFWWYETLTNSNSNSHCIKGKGCHSRHSWNQIILWNNHCLPLLSSIDMHHIQKYQLVYYKFIAGSQLNSRNILLHTLCKLSNPIQWRPAIFRFFLFFFASWGIYHCFIAVCIRIGQDVWKCCQHRIFFLLQRLLFFFLLLPVLHFFSPVSRLRHQNHKYASKAAYVTGLQIVFLETIFHRPMQTHDYVSKHLVIHSRKTNLPRISCIIIK